MFWLEMVEPFIEVLRNSAEVDPLVALCVNEVLCRLQHIVSAVFAYRFRSNFASTLSCTGLAALVLGLVLVLLLKQFLRQHHTHE